MNVWNRNQSETRSGGFSGTDLLAAVCVITLFLGHPRRSLPWEDEAAGPGLDDVRE